MTMCKTKQPARRLITEKRGIRSSIAMATASLCLFTALAGCTSSARFTEVSQEAVPRLTASQSQGTVPRLTADQSQGAVPRLVKQESESQDSSPTQSMDPALEGSGTMASRPTLSCNYYIEKEFMASIEAAGRQGDTDTGSGARQYSMGKGTAAIDIIEKGAAEADSTEKSATATDSAGNNPTGSAGNNPTGSSGRIAGGITPHHLLAAEMIAGFFREFSDDPPKTIVVIGPNHKRRGFGGLQTSSSDWATPFGRLEADGEIVKMLVEKLGASENDSIMQDEHSISALVPYIRYYMPDVRIVPILLHGNYTSADSLQLGKLLGKIAADDPGSIAIVASVDFSHYLDADTAYKMDDITLEAIKNNDIPAISRMSNDNMDSPPSIITLLGAMGEAGAAGPEAAGHSNSSDIAGSGYDNTTSYFTMFFRYSDR